MKQETMGWQWHQLDHMQISTSSLNFFTGQMLFLTSNQLTVSKLWRHKAELYKAVKIRIHRTQQT